MYDEDDEKTYSGLLTEDYNPSVSCADSSLYTREPKRKEACK